MTQITRLISRKLPRHWYNYFFPLLLILITTLICLLNYSANTWLIGWDTLLPELNYSSQLENVIYGSWRQDQGLGTIAAHSHMSELPRIIFLWFADLIFPSNMVRYLYIFTCFILGPLGVYFFLKKAVFTKKYNLICACTAFLGALFYIFNLGTLQHFYVVFEMFVVQYAALGWLFLYATKCFYQAKFRNFAWLFLISFLSSSMAYASQLWVAYALGLILYLVVLFLKEKNKLLAFKKICLIGFLTFAANAYWLLPTCYFLFSGASQVPMDSLINETFSKESFLYNQAFAGFSDTISLKNFLFDWQKYNFESGQFEDLLLIWKNHLSFFLWQIFPFILALIAGLGIIFAFFQKKIVVLGIGLVCIMSLFVIMNSSPAFNWLFEFLRENISVLKEGLRTPWTKFSLLLMFALAVFFAYACHNLFTLFLSKQKTRFTLLTTFFFSLLFIGYCWPFFSGELINSKLKVQIPSEYFEFWSWAQQKPASARMALLPAPTYSAWEYYQWGYEGAGFLWFGMPQPLLTRDFDRWGATNETFYRQISTSIDDLNLNSFAQTIEKYQVSYLIIDESMFRPDSSYYVGQAEINNIREFIYQLGYLRVFSSGTLEVFETPFQSTTGFLDVPETFEPVQSTNLYTRLDPVYKNSSSNWQSNDSTWLSRSTLYPFSNFSQDEVNNINVLDASNLLISSNISADKNTIYQLIMPKTTIENNYLAKTELYYDGQTVKINFLPSYELLLDKQLVTPKEKLPPLTIDLSEQNYQSIIVDFGGREISLNANEKKETFVLLPIGQSIMGRVFSQSQIAYDNDTKYVNSSQVIDFEQVVNNWYEIILPEERTVADISNIEVLLKPVANTISLASTFSNQANNCSAQPPQFESVIINDDYISMETIAGTTCFQTILPDFSHYLGYIMGFSEQNINGRPLKFNVYNHQQRQIDFTKIVPEQTGPPANINYVILPWHTTNNAGYSLDWQNQSVVKEEAINQISDNFNIYAFDLFAILDIYLKPVVNNINLNSLELENIKNSHTQYQANIKNNANTDGLLVLGQSYESGWQAKLNGQKLTKGIYNGWANSWIIPPNSTGKITIYYWPQNLQWWGFGILILTIIGGIIYKFWLQHTDS